MWRTVRELLVSSPTYATEYFEGESARETAKAGKNQAGSESRLWKTMECEAPSEPAHEPDGDVAKTSLISTCEPDGRMRSTRAAPDAVALRIAVPDSSSEPAILLTVPVNVTPEIELLATCAASERRRSV